MLVLAELGFVRLLTIPYVFAEVERNLEKKLQQAIPRYEKLRASIQWEIFDNPDLQEVNRWAGIVPAKDAPVLAAAVKAKPVRLITHDNLRAQL